MCSMEQSTTVARVHGKSRVGFTRRWRCCCCCCCCLRRLHRFSHSVSLYTGQQSAKIDCYISHHRRRRWLISYLPSLSVCRLNYCNTLASDVLSSTVRTASSLNGSRRIDFVLVTAAYYVTATYLNFGSVSLYLPNLHFTCMSLSNLQLNAFSGTL